MQSRLLDPKIQAFIDAHVGHDPSQLALRKNPFPDVDWPSIINQIASKTKARYKLPKWFETPNILYPPKLSIEQASSDITAIHKASIINGDALIDLTGGFGADDFYFSKTFKQVIHCEIQPGLSEIVSHNFGQLNANNIQCIVGDSAEILKSLHQKFDWIYVDPSRRHDAKGKVFMLKDCTPSLPDLQDFYFGYSNHLLVKTAPILDIAAGLSELSFVKTIHIVAVENEVKELLWEIENGFTDDIHVKTVNFSKSGNQIFDFVLPDEHFAAYAEPQKYLYEPNAAVMKSGGFDALSHAFDLAKLHRHSHLYTSNQIVKFPGRVFEIKQQLPYQKNEMKNWLENKKANVSTRNFPESVESIRKKWKIKDGGDNYCFFTTDSNNRKIVLICAKI